MDLYTDCPDCDGKGYTRDTKMCGRCQHTGIVPVRVKPLEWVDIDPIVMISRPRRYTLKATETGWCEFGWWCVETEHTYPTLEAAQAACQEHHERIVMSMLEVV